ncbi:hypothetical protein PSN45_002606 [Yamadazyma tenuis]|uniref:Mitochondrial thiamine pyrophosphate carrier 1 n=1 Tax=Candida tenuis (strain ATCC 10573 / BCRC 21748 / CBS 615 / JCM 9827 / NBRC 10315 / NRRL Y-1498 / VKM Y-70) TaxID=590646 RepID=G3AZV5_CANTC|nr:mitochondrial carrier [Yamadazyma tenuis ATCC 10573]XP_006684936.1 uncharacterized protein CANTEDRAFT_112989 [Yamadazyma tenuis ATCC 10573]EGV65249.1 mitochondrial carrier [Yamadazyma tenuis ATCC 10573]EGV65250.1 hypothetical protein CANTEDRAFT_112989 [Yamadazyma tenuis ATCC 10573]WEJ95096.1 hypothetical protein PSN45_002606 [Yamadazyma tenuis]
MTHVDPKPSSQTPSGGIPAITGSINHTNAIHVFPEHLQPWKPTVISYGSSFLSTTIGFPMDTIKTRMQTHPEFKSYFDCALKTYKAEGINGFFRGIWAPLVSSSFSKSINVSLFTQCKPYVHNGLFPYDDSDIHPFVRNIPTCFLSGMVAGAGVSVFACPFEFTKIFAQISKLVERNTVSKASNGSTLATFKKIIKYEGPMGLYSGFRYHIVRDALSSGVYYSVYETMKYTMNTVINKDATKNSPISVVLAGGLSGVTCWIVVFPIDTAKSLLQKQVVSNIFCKKDRLQPKPVKRPKITISRNMYRGLGISVTRSFIVNMVFFSTFEFLMGHIA